MLITGNLAGARMALGCICYITDRNYLFPSFVSAVQARRHASPHLADVRIFLAERAPAVRKAFAEACERESIHLDTVPDCVHAIFDEITHKKAEKVAGKISVAAFGRLFLSEMLPPCYDHFLYIDGDTQIVSSLDPLLEHHVPAGKFLAARDCVSLMRGTSKSWLRDASINMDRMKIPPRRRKDYFNSGVLRANVEGWSEAGRRAVKYWLATPDLDHRDQDALNGALWRNHILISSRWNFPKQLLGLTARDRVQPAIIHFLGQPKPWHGSYAPWSSEEVRPYREILARYPALRPYCPRLPFAQGMAYKVKARMDARRNAIHGEDVSKVESNLFGTAFAV